MTDREVMQQALEAFHEYHETDRGWGRLCETMKNIRARLAEPEPEPFGYLWPTGRHPEFRFTQQKRDGVDGMPLYTAPPTRRPLTDEKIYEMYNEPRSDAEMIDFARAIEAAHGIKEPE